MAPIGKELEKLSDPKLENFKKQNFDDIRARCLSAGIKWTDEEFGHDKNSLGESEDFIGYIIEWKRVHEISKEPKLFIKGYCEDDVIQGRVNDCWFIASVASLALQHPLVENVIPHSDKQELGREDYCGVLLFRFHRFGEWIEVVVDDYLPIYYDEENYNELTLASIHSNNPNEFWAAFLEKAYAKLDGSYAGLDWGVPADALNDLTGGISETINCDEAWKCRITLQKVYRQLDTALSRGSVVCVTINDLSKEGLEKGLHDHHAYSLLECYYVPQHVAIPEKYKREVVKVRNPLGKVGVEKKKTEWTDRWSDDDAIWSKIPQEVKKAMEYENKNDGEFWMEFDDLLYYFNELTICRMIKTDPDGGDNCWHLVQKYSSWIPGSTAGGMEDDTFYTNPQFQFQIEHEHDETVQIVLEQPDTRSDQGKKNMSIGFAIFKVAGGNKVKIDDLNATFLTATEHSNSRQIYKKFELDVGTYVIIPSTFDPNVAGEFLLKIFTENEAHVTELKD